jgi:hypothetical protein
MSEKKSFFHAFFFFSRIFKKQTWWVFLAFYSLFLPGFLPIVEGLGLDSLTFDSSLLALPQKSLKESIHRLTIPAIGPALVTSE